MLDLRACPAVALPGALADLYDTTAVGDVTAVRFARDLDPQVRADVVEGGSFREVDATRGVHHLARVRSLPDRVAPGMRVLVCGLNPSLFSADAGVDFARPGNRFWPAALAAGLVAHERDAVDALVGHGIGMTDLVKRATPRADGLTTDEYRDGLGRVERLVAWLRPRAVVFVGLAGWRAAVDRRATAGPAGELGGRPVYLMPSTSGLNAHSRPDDLAEHLRAAAALAGQTT